MEVISVMQSLEEKKVYHNVIAKTCYATDIIYLLLHIVYMGFFIKSGATVMIYLNIASIVGYIFFVYLIIKGKYYAYALCCGNEFLVFMSIATILCGFNSGFHLCIIGLCVVSFFTTYFSKNKRIHNAIIWAGMSFAVYVTLYFVCAFNEPMYALEKWVEMTFFMIHTVAIFLFVVVYLLIFVKYAIQLETRIMNESRVDNLTKLHNRYDLYNYLDFVEDKSDYMLSIFDIDNFKKVNDIYGHICGDYVLQEIAKIATNTLKDEFVSRYGGEEFIIISKVNNDFEKAFNKIDDFRKSVENYPFVYEGKKIHITITIGVQLYEQNLSTEKWIDLADEKLYYGKNHGKNITVR